MRDWCKKLLNDKSAVILDTETTGLKDDDEVLQIGILGLDGTVLLDALIRPCAKRTWTGAQAVHGISPEQVQDMPHIGVYVPALGQLLLGRTVIVYNAAYDYRLLWQSLEAAGIESNWLGEAEWVDVMEPYAEHWGDWNDWHQFFTWQRLTSACRQQGLPVVDEHSAIGDCRMTLALLRKVAE